MSMTLSKTVLSSCHSMLVKAMGERGLKHRLSGDSLDEQFVPKGEKSFFIPIVQSDRAEQKVWGVVLVPDVPDDDGHVVAADEIERVAHRFMEMSRVMDVEHSGQFPDLTVVESFIVRSQGYRLNEQEVPLGAWVLGAHIKPLELWKRVEDGEFCGFSIKAFCVIEQEDEDSE